MSDTEIHTISPRTFMDRVMPSYARLYIEVSHNEHKTQLDWNSEHVQNWFVLLTGFNPYALQFANTDMQLAALDAAHELEHVLYYADEVLSLDGNSAIYFAHGFMTGRDLQNRTIIDESNIDLAKERCSQTVPIDHRPQFLAGFEYRISRK